MLSRLRVPLLCSFLLLVTTIVSAETIRFDPPNPTGSRSVDGILTGVWPNGCLPIVRSVVITSTTITLHLDATPPPGFLCTQALGPYTRTFHLGILPPGGYTVIAVADAGTTSTELARAPLIVRDAETIIISPYALPITGGRISLLSLFEFPGTLTIGGVSVPIQVGGDIPPWAIAPPHAPGAADVTVNTALFTATSKAALIYYDPAAADPAVFEPILFPVSFQGPGALGSQWVTENFIYGSGQAFFRDLLPCAGCSQTPLAASTQLINNGNPWGHVLYAMRGTAESLAFASRIRDTSRQSQTAGTEVPVVRERDFRNQLRFLNIPVDPRYRVMLRLWSIGDGGQFSVIVDSTPAQFQGLTVAKIPGTSMSFGSMDVTSLLTKAGNNPSNLTVVTASSLTVPPPIWGMLSITNNDTQQVTIVSPR